jgi:hypothetical protein
MYVLEPRSLQVPLNTKPNAPRPRRCPFLILSGRIRCLSPRSRKTCRKTLSITIAWLLIYFLRWLPIVQLGVGYSNSKGTWKQIIMFRRTEHERLHSASSENSPHYTPYISISLPLFSGLETREYGHRDTSRWPHGTLYPQKLALTSLTSGGRSVSMVPS